MSRILNPLKSYASYAFIVVGAIWVVVAFSIGSYLLLWPVITCFATGILLRLWPGDRLTWAWASATAVLGFLLAGYQAYVALTLVGGALSSLASASAGAFSVFALVHLLLLYVGNSGETKLK